MKLDKEILDFDFVCLQKELQYNMNLEVGQAENKSYYLETYMII